MFYSWTDIEKLGYENPTDEQGTAFINNSVNYIFSFFTCLVNSSLK